MDINSLQNISRLASEMIEGNNISNPDRGAELQKIVKRTELLIKQQEINKLLETEIKRNQDILNSSKSSARQKEDAETILKLAKEYLDTQEDINRALQIYSELEIDKNLIVSQMQQESDVLKSLAERKKEINPYGGGSRNFAEAEKLDIAIRYEEQLIKIQKMELSNKYSPQFIASLKAQLDEITNYDLSKIEEKFSVFGQAIKEPMQQAFTSLFGDVVRGTKSIGEVLNGFLSQIANFFATIAAQLATNAMMGFFKNLGLFNIAGFSGGGTVTSSGQVSNFKEGGIVALETPVASSSTLNRDAITRIANFAKGGEVLDLGLAVHQALKREGTGGVPVVAHIGEQILTTRNGDAQLFRQLEKSGEWDRIKYNFKYQGDFIPNFKMGGPVGNINTVKIRTPQGNPQGAVYNYTLNVTTKDADSFRKSKSLIAQEQKLMMERNNRFN